MKLHLPLRSAKAGRFEKLLGFARSQFIVKLGSVSAPPLHTLRAFQFLTVHVSIIWNVYDTKNCIPFDTKNCITFDTKNCIPFDTKNCITFETKYCITFDAKNCITFDTNKFVPESRHIFIIF